MSATFTFEAGTDNKQAMEARTPAGLLADEVAPLDGHTAALSDSRFPTTIAMVGVILGVAFAAAVILAGWPPAVALPQFTAMICAGLFSVAGGGIGMLLQRDPDDTDA